VSGDSSLIANGGPVGRYRLPALHHALDVLEYLGERHQGATLSEIAVAIGLSRPGAHRILANLHERGYVTKHPATHSYGLGLRLWELGLGIPWLTTLRESLLPLLHELLSVVRETIHVATLDGCEIIYVEKLETPQHVRSYADMGDRAPAHAVATGKILLSQQPAAYLDALYPNGRLPSYTNATISRLAKLRAELEEARSAGFALNRGEWRDGVNGVAVALDWHRLAPPLALGIAGPAYRFDVEAARAAVPALRGVAEQVGRAA